MELSGRVRKSAKREERPEIGASQKDALEKDRILKGVNQALELKTREVRRLNLKDFEPTAFFESWRGIQKKKGREKNKALKRKVSQR